MDVKYLQNETDFYLKSRIKISLSLIIFLVIEMVIYWKDESDFILDFY